MIIDLRSVPAGAKDFEFVLDKDWWRPGDEKDQVLAIDAPIEVKIGIHRSGDKYVLDGQLSGGLQVLCDRCLESYHRKLRSVFRVFLALPVVRTDKTEIELAEEDLEVDFIMGEEIDLDEIIREQIYLSLPMKCICNQNCRGLCPMCGSNLNDRDCQCERGQGHPAFLKLKRLKVEGE